MSDGRCSLTFHQVDGPSRGADHQAMADAWGAAWKSRLAAVIIGATAVVGCGERSDSDPGSKKPCVCDAAAASGGGGGAATDAGAGGVPGACAEYRVGVSTLPSMRKWDPTSLQDIHLPLHPFWRDTSGVHVVWSAYSIDPTDGTKLTARLVLTSFPASAGGVPEHAIYDVYPEGITPAILSGGVSDAAASPDGAVAVGIRYATSLATDLTEKVLLTRLDQPAKQQVWIPPWPTSQLFLWEIAWDGEAFALHFALSNPGPQDWGIRLVRLSPDGTVLSGPVVVANSAVVQDSFSVSTDSVTGTTLFAFPGNNGPSLSGHLRDGTPVFPNEPYLTKEVAALGVPLESSKFAEWPAVAVDGDDAVLGWEGMGLDNESYVQRLNSFAPAAPAIVIPEPGGGMRQRVLTRSPQGWLMMGKIHAHIDAFEIEGNAITAQRPVVTHSFESCWKTDSCPDWPVAMDARNLQLVRWQDDVLFGFLDYSDNYLDSAAHPDPLVAYRIVNPASDCQYRSLYDEHHSGKDAGP